jgi:putative hydrolase of the HAD superfamily
MTMNSSSGASKAILIDVGGVLLRDRLPAVAAAWSARLGVSERAFLDALFGGSDDQVLTGRVSEHRWWAVVAGRLHADRDLVAELRRDLASEPEWDGALVAFLRGLRGCAKIAVVSNAWPAMRTAMARAGVLDVADEIVLSCEIGYAKPDARIYAAALERIAAEPGSALFIDDTPRHVAAAEALGMTGYLHASTSGTIARMTDFLRGDGNASQPGQAG